MGKYRLFGSETSPYSMKVRNFLRYKKVEFDWVPKNATTEPEFNVHAQLPTVPLLVSPENQSSQDSSAILARMEIAHPDPTAQPDDPGVSALSMLFEDYADEWVNKIMFHYRWAHSPDRENAAERVLEQLLAGRRAKDKAAALQQVVDSMSGRLPTVGAGGDNGKVLEASFLRLIRLLDAHLKEHLCLFGGHPSIADFALSAQLSQMLSDPTPGERIRDEAPFVTAWCEFMESPTAGAPWAELSALEPTLGPLLKEEVAVAYLPWAVSNAQGTSRRRKVTKVELPEGPFEQTTQRYAGASFKAMKKEITKAKPKKALKALFSDSGVSAQL